MSRLRPGLSEKGVVHFYRQAWPGSLFSAPVVTRFPADQSCEHSNKRHTYEALALERGRGADAKTCCLSRKPGVGTQPSTEPCTSGPLACYKWNPAPEGVRKFPQ